MIMTVCVLVASVLLLTNVGTLYVLNLIRQYLVIMSSDIETVHMEVNSRLTRTQEKLDTSLGSLGKVEEKLVASHETNTELAKRILSLEALLIAGKA